MQTLMELYGTIYSRIQSINDRVRQTDAALSDLEGRGADEIAARIANLEAQIEKIEEFAPRIEAFRELAKQHIGSMNILTVDTPPNYRVNLNRLRRWSQLIDPLSKEDPNAQKVFFTASCDLRFLQKKRELFEKRIASLRDGVDTALESERERALQIRAAAERDLGAVLDSQEMADFALRLAQENQAHWYNTAPDHYRDSKGLECDAVVHLRNGSYGLIEIKLGGEKLIEEGVKTLNTLEAGIDTNKMLKPSFKMVLIGIGDYAYRRPDGIYVVPIGCLKD